VPYLSQWYNNSNNDNKGRHITEKENSRLNIMSGTRANLPEMPVMISCAMIMLGGVATISLQVRLSILYTITKSKSQETIVARNNHNDKWRLFTTMVSVLLINSSFALFQAFLLADNKENDWNKASAGIWGGAIACLPAAWGLCTIDKATQSR